MRRFDNLRLGLIAIFLLGTASAFYTWPLDARILYGFFIMITPLMIYGFIDLHRIEISKLVIGSTVVFVFLVVALPFRQFDDYSFGFVLSFIVFLLILMKNEVYGKVIDVLALVVAWVSASALLVFLTNLAGLDLPWLRMDQNFRINQADFYRIYPGSVVLSTQIWDAGSVTVLRTSGILQEPGHFGIFCIGILVANGFEFTRKRYRFVVLGGFLTLSPAFFVLFALGLLIKYTSTVAHLFKLSIAASVLLLALAFGTSLIPSGLYERLVGQNAEALAAGGVAAVIESRTAGNFNKFYDEIELSQKIWGLGLHAVQGLGLQSAQSSDYRSFIVKFGMLPLLMYFGLVVYIAVNCRNRRQMTMLIIYFLGVAAHRAGTLLQVWFPFMLAAAVYTEHAVFESLKARRYVDPLHKRLNEEHSNLKNSLVNSSLNTP